MVVIVLLGQSIPNVETGIGVVFDTVGGAVVGPLPAVNQSDFVFKIRHRIPIHSTVSGIRPDCLQILNVNERLGNFDDLGERRNGGFISTGGHKDVAKLRSIYVNVFRCG